MAIGLGGIDHEVVNGCGTASSDIQTQPEFIELVGSADIADATLLGDPVGGDEE